MLCRQTAQTDVPLLFTFASLVQTFGGFCAASDVQAAAWFCRAAKQFGVSDAVMRAAVRAWSDRFGQGDNDATFDRHPVSEGRR